MPRQRLWPVMLMMLLLAACAQVAEISGGPKDEIAPELVSADPPHLSTNFTGNEIELFFNERIQLDRVRDRLLISPPLSVAPQVRLTGPKSVSIALKEELKPNTTYVIGIGEAVKDLTEGNSAAGVMHVFSTGAFVDTAMIAGSVTNAFNGIPEKDVTVLVHYADDTSSFRSSRPAYATRTDVNGRFMLKHLPERSFRIFALRDQNSNYRYDLPNEEIAFLDTPVRALPADTSMPIHDLRLFKERSRTQQIRSSTVTADGAFRVVLEKPVDTIAIRDLDREGGRSYWLPEFSSARDTVSLWPSDTTAIALGRYQVSADGEPLDTLRYRRLERLPFLLSMKVAIREERTPVIHVTTSRPIASIDSSLIQLTGDSLRVDLAVEKHGIRDFKIHAPIGPGQKVQLLALPGAVVDIYGGQNDTLKIALGRAAEQSTGILRVNVSMFDSSNGPYIIQLLDRQGNVLQEEMMATLSGPVIWERLMPGEVRLRLIEDRNGDGKWSTGSLEQRIQPEKVRTYTEPINIRAAWDIGVDWVIGQRSLPDRGESGEP